MRSALASLMCKHVLLTEDLPPPREFVYTRTVPTLLALALSVRLLSVFARNVLVRRLKAYFKSWARKSQHNL